jgi:ribonuclease HII
MALIAGADEAGRGCVIGPLVLCVYALEAPRQAELKRMGVRDSKLLTAEQRERLAKELPALGEHELVEIPAEELTRLMTRKVSLNEIEALRLADGLKALNARGVRFTDLYVDSPDPAPGKFAQRIQRHYAGDARIIAENYADKRYAVVGAASILAKVRRDERLEEIKRAVGEDFGSGYTHDPVTIAYLAKHHRDAALQPFLRHKWATVKRLLQPGRQQKLEHF